MDDLDLSVGEPPKKSKRSRSLIVFLVGLAIGLAGALLVPRYLGTYLPAGLGGGRETLEGPVLGKRQEDGRLLLTVDARQGAVLATFSERVAEIDLLVDVGDTVTLGVAGYEPFIDDPAFRGIRKAPRKDSVVRQPPGAGAAEGRTAGSEAGVAAGDSGAVSDSASAGAPVPAGEDDPGAPPPSMPQRDEEEAPGDTARP